MTLERFNFINNEIDKIRACDRITEQEADELEMMLFQSKEEFEEFSAIENKECVLCDGCGHYVLKDEYESDIDLCKYCIDNSDSFKSYKDYKAKQNAEDDRGNYLYERMREEGF